MAAPEDDLARIARYFETLTPQALERLDGIYTEDASFKDPFNEVRGLAAVRGVYQHMYASLDAPRFVVTGRMAAPGEGVLRWDFHFRFKGKAQEQVVRGASWLVLSADGRISAHRDYWDAAEELYEKLPVLGSLMRWLKRRAGGSGVR